MKRIKKNRVNLIIIGDKYQFKMKIDEKYFKN